MTVAGTLRSMMASRLGGSVVGVMALSNLGGQTLGVSLQPLNRWRSHAAHLKLALLGMRTESEKMMLLHRQSEQSGEMLVPHLQSIHT